MKIEGFFVCHLLKPFFSTKTFVDTANEQQNRYYFPILCISIQALVDLTNIPRFSLWHWAGYFIWLRKSSLKNYVFKALLLLRTMLNRWCGSPVKAIEKQRIGKRQRPLFCRKWSKVWEQIFCLLCLLVTKKKKEKEKTIPSRWSSGTFFKKNHVS